jgi:hypothetical protein
MRKKATTNQRPGPGINVVLVGGPRLLDDWWIRESLGVGVVGVPLVVCWRLRYPFFLFIALCGAGAAFCRDTPFPPFVTSSLLPFYPHILRLRPYTIPSPSSQGLPPTLFI